MNRFLLSFCFFLSYCSVNAQSSEKSKSKFVASELFSSSSFLPSGNSYRLATGEPGPDYWQNRADYKIDVSLDDKAEIISGIETITYYNNSPKELTFLWLQMDQNVYQKHSKGLDAKLFLSSNAAESKFEGGFNIESILLNNRDKATFAIHDTRMRIELSEPLPSGQKISFQIKYTYKFPRNFRNADFNVNRTDILPTKNGDIYSVAQWYPRLCVLDDVSGWNTLPYLGNGEFYLEYGNFDVNITLPSAYIVEASGDLLNPEEVLTSTQLERWKKAKTSSEKVFIRTIEEITDPTSRPAKPLCTWKFKLNQARDFAWTASKSFVWEGLEIVLPSGKKVLGSSLYPVESKRSDSWDRSSEYIKFTLQYFSKQWYEYPYNKAVNVASNLDGMEYPGLVFCAAKDKGNMYWAVVNHELGHTWFPMIVGSNERKHAWMDEGFNAFMDNMATKDFNGGEFPGYPEIDVPVKALFADSLVAIMTRPDVIPGNQVYTIQYQKVAYLLTLLREEILGKERFDPAFRKYISDWAYKHPTPWDFFSSINSSTGEDLNWFWKSMFLENYKLDQKITQVVNPQKGKSQKAKITVENMGKAAMPLKVEVTFENGQKESHNFPVEIWEQGLSYSFSPDSDGSVTKVVIDPQNIFPDVKADNNSWTINGQNTKTKSGKL
ncbi:M1 family metallopeptidase [Dyadobacter subterraneus]|uniref:M1 family metallopeptidase n=1 Tax=Dyadobacter subterraneus TaxID=2773304 RepID=A0ABR9W858_9BACT|nr:M1 family metallopeptidase [Dyadobacter subterraneus]MBE9461627.1 M1 family metallopeptidase [Dyadobacter subterraneus]